jgi:GTP-binding protein
VSDYLTVNHELRAYNPALAERPQIVVATKIDALEDAERVESLKQQAEADGRMFFAISAVANKGTRELIFAVAAKLDEINEAQKTADTIELSL